MDAQTFLAEFGHIVNAPGGVARLREMVLHLAAAGKLIQESGNSDAPSLLRSIERQKGQHPERKKVIPKQPPISREQQNIPLHWAPCRLGDLALTITGGGTPAKNHPAYWGGDIPWASVKDLKDSKYIDDTEDHITQEGLENSSSNLIEKGRMIVCTRMGLGKIAINRVPIAINQDLKALELPAEVNPDFFTIIYKTRKIKGTGTTVSGIRQEQLLALPAGLPPKEEQALIVAKVDELMALCDRLEEQHKERLALQGQLRETALSTVATAQSQSQLKVAWARAESNLACLVEKPEHVSQLKDAAFNLALHGYLNPSSQLTNTATSEDEGLSPLPLGWRWDTLAGLSDDITSGSRGWKAYLAPRGDAFIRSQDIKHDAVIFENPAWVSLPDKTEGTRTLVRPGDILLTITGGNVGKCAVVPPLAYKAYVSQHVALIRLKDPRLAGFVHFWMTNAYGGRRYLSRYIYGDKPGLNLTQVGSVPVPVPPPEVVVEILEGLRTYETNFRLLEKQLRSKEQLAKSLATAAVSALTGIGAVNDEDDSVKAPQTELIAPLRLGATPDVKELAPLATILARHHGEMSAKDLWQRFGGEIDAFYAQLKTEVANGWIREPAIAEMREVPQAQASA